MTNTYPVITIVGAHDCVPCQNAKKLVEKLDLDYGYFDIKSQDRTERLAGKRILKGRGYPLIIIGETEYEGFTDEVQKLLNEIGTA